MSASTPNLIKQVNLQCVRSALLELKSATKPQLAEYTSLSVITINALIRYLKETGEVLEDSMTHPGLGRPAMSYKLNEEFCMALIIYTFEKDGQDTAFFVVRNLYGDSVESFAKSISVVLPDSFDTEIESLLKKYPAIRLIGFGLPATESGGTIISSDYASLIGYHFCEEKKRRFHLPVFLVNDIKAATVGYCYNHHIASSRCVMGLYLPNKYDPGIGLFYDGKLFSGCAGLAGRIAPLMPHIHWDDCDYQENKHQDVILQLIYKLSCLYNPDIIIVYSEAPLSFLREQIDDYFTAPVDRPMKPNLVLQKTLEQDFRAGISHLALDQLFHLEFPICSLEI